MDQTTLDTLEYPAVLRELADRASTPPGMEKALGLKPSTDMEAIVEAFREYREAWEILKALGRLPLGGVFDIRPVLSRIEPEGAYLLQDDLLKVRGNLEVSMLLKSLSTPQFSKTYPRFSSIIDALSDQRELHGELVRILDDRGRIKDTASHRLFGIRKEINAGKERARSIIEAASNDKKIKEYLQEDFITIRDDRYVLSIKAGMHGFVSGVIHGRSGSGATYFIEPLALVELNNRVAILKKEEVAEEIEILKAATSMVSGVKEAIIADLDVIGRIDLAQAKAVFAGETGAVVPVMKKDGEVRLKGARHPLLVLKAKKAAAEGEAAEVVPVDIFIPDGCRVLVISGANTGGKTVALKTLGLLTLMALSAVPVPVEEGSEAVVFGSIFSDIGDRQDIIASLSTFSAHIKRIRGFLEAAGRGSLVLMDEIGVGTDPSEGSALALAALESFRQRGAVAVVTTHLNLLKAHAQADPAFLNASVEFDEATLRPLYRLRYGVPGPSLGLSIARSLGIPSDIIETAAKNLKESEGAFIESVRKLEEEKDEIKRLKEKLAALEENRRAAVERLRADREKYMQRASGRVDEMVEKARGEIRKALEEFRAGKKTEAPGKKASAAVTSAGAGLKARLNPNRVKYVPAEGDKVVISGSNSRGAVVKVDTELERAELTVGSVKVWVAWDKLAKRGGPDRARGTQDLHISSDMDIASSLNIIGMRVEEALPVVTRFIDNAHASGLSRVEIIHGVGTGRLAKAVQGHLGSNPAVRAFGHADPARGGAGVTIVELT